MSSILAFRREALPTLRYLPKDTKLALGMTLLELHYILKSSEEDSRATGGLVSNLPHPWVNKTKQHTPKHAGRRDG